MIWFTADLHIGHKNIVKGTSEWKQGGMRNFITVESHDSHIVNKINEYVKEEDILVILGDLMFGDKDYSSLFSKINTKNIIVLRGNHDNVDKLTEACEKHKVQYLGWRENITYLKQNIVLSHEPILSWDNMNKGSWMLYGHCHGNLQKITNDLDVKNNMMKSYYYNMKTLDVGIDAVHDLFGEYRPISFDEIKEIMSKKNNNSIDHH